MDGDYPADGSVVFIEERGYDELAHPNVLSNIYGVRAALPGYWQGIHGFESERQPVLAPVVQYYTREWIDAGPVPDWADSPLETVPIQGANYRFLALASETTNISSGYLQRRWRIAWSLGANPRVIPGWGFIHLRYRVAEWTRFNNDESAPDVDRGEFEKWWQKGVSTPPGDYDEAAPLTWPGTDWREEAMPSITGDPGSDIWLSWRWPRFNRFTDPNWIFWGHAQGLIPGGHYVGHAYSHPHAPSGAGFLKVPL